MAKFNYRFILTIAVLGMVVLLAGFCIFIAYEQASSHAIGNFAPVGNPTNFKHKSN
jgi:hypothetical protein